MGHELTRFDKLDREYRQLLGKKSTLLRMIDRRNKMLSPLLKEVHKLKGELEKLHSDLEELKPKIKEIAKGEKWEPPIVITKAKIKGYDYLRGKVRFGDKEKVKMIPKALELQFLKEIRAKNEEKNLTDDELKGVLYGKLRGWVLNWWRTEGILQKK